MSSTECESLVKRHPDLAVAAQKIIEQFREMGTAEAINSDDLASFLDLDPNQVEAVLMDFAETGFLCAEEMVTCTHCGMVALRSDYDKGFDNDGEYRCTDCDTPLGSRTIRAATTYRRGEKWPEISGGSDVPELDEASPPTIPAPMTFDEQAFYSPDRLAEIYSIRSKDALRMRLKRYRDKYFDGGWKENKDRRPREPQYLYKLRDVKPILTELQASSQRSAK